MRKQLVCPQGCTTGMFSVTANVRRDLNAAGEEVGHDFEASMAQGKPWCGSCHAEAEVRQYLEDGDAMYAVGRVEFILDSTQNGHDPAGFRIGNWGETHFVIDIGVDREDIRHVKSDDADQLYYVE
jgi:hypothetical protein